MAPNPRPGKWDGLNSRSFPMYYDNGRDSSHITLAGRCPRPGIAMLDAQHRLSICLEAVGRTLVHEAARLRSHRHMQETPEALKIVMLQLRVLCQAGAALDARNYEQAERLLRTFEASRIHQGHSISPAILDAIEDRPV